VLQVRLYKAGTREVVSTQDVPMNLGATQYESINEESECKTAKNFEQGLQSIGVRESGIEVALPGTTRVVRMRIESGQSLAEGRFIREGDAYQLVNFKMDPPATASLYWEVYDKASRQFVLAYQKSEVRFTTVSAKDLAPHAAGSASSATHR
jgi:hypothetical protein